MHILKKVRPYGYLSPKDNSSLMRKIQTNTGFTKNTYVLRGTTQNAIHIYLINNIPYEYLYIYIYIYIYIFIYIPYIITYIITYIIPYIIPI